MSSAYLTPGELATYGADGATTQQIAQASSLIDSYLGRPEGLVWGADFMGLPAYMVAQDPTFSTTLPVALPAGRDVTISFPIAATGAFDLLGEVVVLESGSTQSCEAVAIIGVDQTAGTVTFGQVMKAHASGATMDFGRSIFEERVVASKRSVARVSRSQMVRLQSGLGRYSYGRRSDQVAGLYADVNLLATVQALGGPPPWVPFDVTQADISQATNEIWVPAGLMLAYFSDVRVRYLAGFPAASLPSYVKQATANVINKIISFGDNDPSFRVMQAGGTRLERWTDSALDTDTKALLSSLSLSLTF